MRPKTQPGCRACCIFVTGPPVAADEASAPLTAAAPRNNPRRENVTSMRAPSLRESAELVSARGAARVWGVSGIAGFVAFVARLSDGVGGLKSGDCRNEMAPEDS